MSNSLRPEDPASVAGKLHPRALSFRHMIAKVQQAEDALEASERQVAADWRALYVFDLQPQAEIDHVVGNWYVSTHPDSPFMGQLRVARTGPGWRRTLGSGGVALHRTGLASERRPLADAHAVIAELQQGFGIRVPAHPGLHAAIEAWLGSGASSSA